MFVEKLENLFIDYLAAFSKYDIDGVAKCYQCPCSLSTPDNVLVLKNKAEFHNEFQTIFKQLKAADTAAIKVLKASCISLNENMVLVCIDWEFLDSNQNVFADFCAFYQLIEKDKRYNIVSVSSHELSLSKQFDQLLNISR